MLSQTQEQIKELIGKLQLLDIVSNTLKTGHKDDEETAEKLFKQASTHKLKLVSEIMRLTVGTEII